MESGARRYAIVRERHANILLKEESSLPTVYQSWPAELAVERSRFIGKTYRLTDPDQLPACLADIEHQHPGANHYTWAYRIDQAQVRANDDGEPHGSAGLPMLNILSRQGWFETLVVVARYFGGIKLGRGGLVRAYQRGAQAALNATVPGVLTPVVKIRLDLDYSLYERINRNIAAHAIAESADYGANVTLSLLMTQNAWPAIQAILNQQALHHWHLQDSQEGLKVLPLSASPGEQ